VHVFFFGLGYSSLATVRWLGSLVSGQMTISGTVRTEKKAEILRAEGISAHLFDGTRPSGAIQNDLGRATHVFFSAAPGPQGDPALNHHRTDLERSDALQWLGYFSTVGVYGDAGGNWINETAPLNPSSERSIWRVGAEFAMAELAARQKVPLAILRLSGIYGPGRSAFDKLRANTARRIVRPGQVFNRVHVNDIGHLSAHAALNRVAGIYNITDDEPAPPQDLVAHAAKLADLPLPPEIPFDEAELGPMARSFYCDNKRVSNRAIKHALGLDLIHPTYREGLAAIFAGEQAGMRK